MTDKKEYKIKNKGKNFQINREWLRALGEDSSPSFHMDVVCEYIDTAKSSANYSWMEDSGDTKKLASQITSCGGSVSFENINEEEALNEGLDPSIWSFVGLPINRDQYTLPNHEAIMVILSHERLYTYMTEDALDSVVKNPDFSEMVFDAIGGKLAEIIETIDPEGEFHDLEEMGCVTQKRGKRG